MEHNKIVLSDDQRLRLLSESEVLLEKYSDKIPVLIQIDSRILKIDKQKFLVSDKLSYSSYIEILKKKLINLNPNDTLNILVTQFNENNEKVLSSITNIDLPLKYMYKENMDLSTKMLIFTISRKTTYKRIKNGIGYYLGY
jgi:hypothetical protein